MIGGGVGRAGVVVTEDAFITRMAVAGASAIRVKRARMIGVISYHCGRWGSSAERLESGREG